MPNRIVCLSLGVLILSVSALAVTPHAVAQDLTCHDRYWSWEAAQTAFEKTFDGRNPNLNPDGNGIACDEMLDWHGFAPAWWTDQVPPGLMLARVLYVKDDDTLGILINGHEDVLRLYRADAPEAYGESECGADLASAALKALLDETDAGWIIWIEQDAHRRDIYDRLLGYAWIEVDEEPLLVNEAMILSGWADDRDYGDKMYDVQMREAEDFAVRFQLGTWQNCINGPNPT